MVIEFLNFGYWIIEFIHEHPHCLRSPVPFERCFGLFFSWGLFHLRTWDWILFSLSAILSFNDFVHPCRISNRASSRLFNLSLLSDEFELSLVVESVEAANKQVCSLNFFLSVENLSGLQLFTDRLTKLQTLLWRAYLRMKIEPVRMTALPQRGCCWGCWYDFSPWLTFSFPSRPQLLTAIRN